MMKKVITGALSLVAVSLIGSGLAIAAQDGTSSLENRVNAMQKTLAQMSQNASRPTQASKMWNEHIRVSGGLAVDAKLAGSLGSGSKAAGRFTGENVKRYGINDAFLNVDAMINDMTSARIGLSYSDVSGNYRHPRHNVSADGFNIDQAYVTLADFNSSPFYMRAGKQYMDYGRYDLHPVTKPMTQVLSQVNDIGIQVGFVDLSGIHASAFVLETPSYKKDGDSVRNTHEINYGFSLAYDHKGQYDEKNMNWAPQGFDFYGKVGYLNNIVGLDAYQRSDMAGQEDGLNYSKSVSGVAFNVGLSTGPFDLNAAYAGATQHFDSDDGLQYQDGKGAQPSAWDFNAGYKFKCWNARDNKITLGYGRSSEASIIGLPENRFYADYTVGMYENTSLTLEWSHDADYSDKFIAPDSDGTGSGRSYNVVTARLAVNFG